MGLGAAGLTSAQTGHHHPLAHFYGNTLITVDGKIETHYWYKANHTFIGKVPVYFYPLKGTWKARPDGIICRVFDPPLPMVSNPDCGPMLVHKVGDEGKFPNGDSLRLVAGVR